MAMMFPTQASWAAGSGAQVAIFGLFLLASSVLIVYRAERILEESQGQIRQLQEELVAVAARRDSYSSSGEALMAGACQNPSRIDADGGAEDNAAGAALNPAFRIMVGVALVAVFVAGFLALKNLDDLPKWLNDAVHHAMGGFRSGSDGGKDSEANEVPLSKLIAYRLDRWFSTNPYSKILALLYITLAMILVGGLGIFSLSSVDLGDALWEAVVGVGIDWTFPSDSNPEDHDSGVQVLAVRFMGLLVSLGGMLVTALMLGIVSDTIGDKVDQMRKGKADVLEKNHTLILGWSDKLYALIGELANANESIGGSAIVIMAEKDKEEMEDAIEAQEIDLRGSRIICRTGNPLLSFDLDKVSVRSARSIVLLAQPVDHSTNADTSDAFTLLVVMSLMSIHHNTEGGLRGHITAELLDIDNESLLQMVTPGCQLETVVAHDVIGRLMIQIRRQPGLAAVWEALLGFEGNEFYSQCWPELTGKTFGDILLSFPDAVPLGVITGKGSVVVNPADSYTLMEDDQVLVLAEDDNTYKPTSVPFQISDLGELPECQIPEIDKERILCLGWRRDLDDMISVLDGFVAPGSELWLFSNVPLEDRREILLRGGLEVETMKNLKLVFEAPELLGEATDRLALKRIEPLKFSTIMILADDTMVQGGAAASDSQALATLLMVRDLQSKARSGRTTPRNRASLRSTSLFNKSKRARNKIAAALGKAEGCSTALGSPIETPTSDQKPQKLMSRRDSGSVSSPWSRHLKSEFSVGKCVVISEILDSRTRNLISELHISEYVMSNELVSKALAMVSESTSVNSVLKELFTEVGNEIYVHGSEQYLRPDEEAISYFQLMARARAEHSVIVVGYLERGSPIPTLNPPNKAERLLSLQTVESVIIIAEDDWVMDAAMASSPKKQLLASPPRKPVLSLDYSSSIKNCSDDD